MTALDHTMKRASRREQLTTARMLRERSRRLSHLARQLNELADTTEAEAMAGGASVLRGRAITEELERIVPVGEKAHYTELEERLRAHGFIAAGEVPANTLLMALRRSKSFRHVGGQRSGTYKRVKAK